MNLDTTAEEYQIISGIAKRANMLGYGTIIDVEMDVTVVHANGNPLKLKELLKADRLNFAHDICGIRNCLNRETGELENCFLPRFLK